MPKVFTSEKQKRGELGENIAIKFLEKHNFSILERNYTKRYGEIDIIAEKENKIYFIEVKSVVIESLNNIEASDYRPEENVHDWKRKRMARTIQAYFFSKHIDDEKEWQVNILIVFLDLKNREAKIKIIEDIIL